MDCMCTKQSTETLLMTKEMSQMQLKCKIMDLLQNFPGSTKQEREKCE